MCLIEANMNELVVLTQHARVNILPYTVSVLPLLCQQRGGIQTAAAGVAARMQATTGALASLCFLAKLTALNAGIRVSSEQATDVTLCSEQCGDVDRQGVCACFRQVECAISRATKEKRVAELEEALRNSTVAFGVRYNKVNVSAPASFAHGLQIPNIAPLNL